MNLRNNVFPLFGYFVLALFSLFCAMLIWVAAYDIRSLVNPVDAFNFVMIWWIFTAFWAFIVAIILGPFIWLSENI